MKTPTTLPITAEQSRAAHIQLGLAQANVIEASDLPDYIQIAETGRVFVEKPVRAI